MSREIRFKFWDTLNKRWDNSGLLYIDEDGRIYEIYEASAAYQTYMHRVDVTDRYERVEYTGLKDKNGTPIYDGDIVQCNFYSASRVWWRDLEHKKEVDADFERQKASIKTICGVVQYDDGRYKIQFAWSSVDLRHVRLGKTERRQGNGADFESRWWDFEVVDNVWENPILLTS